MTTPTWNTGPVKQPDDPLLTWAIAESRKLAGKEPEPEPRQPTVLPPQEHVPLDPDADRVAFEELLAFIAANKDEGTVVTHITVDDFMHGLDEPPADPADAPATAPEEMQP